MKAPQLVPVQVFAVYGNDDDGRRTGLAGICLSKSYADIVAKGKGAWGSNGSIESRKVLLVGDGTVYLLERDVPILLAEYQEEVEAVRQKRVDAALAKLSDEDREVLGLGEA